MSRRPEALLERQVLAALGRDRGLAIFRNEVGEGFYGNVRAQILSVLHLAGRPDLAEQVRNVLDRNRVHFGLHVGSADLMGVVAVDITQSHVGQRVGCAMSLELKSERGAVRPEQEVWLRRMRELGATAEIVRTPGDAALAVERARGGR